MLNGIGWNACAAVAARGRAFPYWFVIFAN
jgi:hypothetical protein